MDILQRDLPVMVYHNDKHIECKIKKIPKDSDKILVEVAHSKKTMLVEISDITPIKEDSMSFSISKDFKEINGMQDDEDDILIRNHIEKNFRIFLNKYSDKYGFLRSINLDNCLEGDYCIFPECYNEAKIVEIDEDYEVFTIEISDKLFKIPKCQLRPIENRIQKLKRQDLKFLYDFIDNRMPMESYNYEKFVVNFINFFKIPYKSINTILEE